MNMLNDTRKVVRKTTLLSHCCLFLVVFFVFSTQLIAQMTIRVTSIPQYFMPVLDSVFIAGTFNSWNPGDTMFALEKDFDGNYVINLSGTNGEEIEFKFTRGDWERGETTLEGGFVANRVEIFENGVEKEYTVANWEDQIGMHTIAGDVIQLDYDFVIPQLARTRRIWMYLPPDYYTSGISYPVVYLHDGQNVFDLATSFISEWDVDGTMQTLIAAGHTQAIVVVVANGEADRIDEYSPWNHPTYGGGDGDLSADFIVSTLKPYIDANYNTLPDRLNTVIGGSSLGGLISYYMALEHDEIFGKALIFSPSFWFDDSVNIFTQQFEKTLPSKIYITAGLNEDEDMVPDITTITDELQLKGFNEDELITIIRSDGAHSEWFWKREYDDGYLWLFEDLLPLTTENQAHQIKCYYDRKSNTIQFEGIDNFDFVICDVMGRIRLNGLAHNYINCHTLPKGAYIFTMKSNQLNYTFKFMVL